MVETAGSPFYEIRIRGVLGDSLVHAFPRLTGSKDGTDTILSGELPDQAALYGVLTQIESLGLQLVGVQQVTPT